MSKQQVAKKQHHFPQMMLKRFTNENDQIFMYDRMTGKISDPRSTETVAFQKHLYSVHYKNYKDTELENIFSKFEDKAKEPIDRIINNSERHDDIQKIIVFISILIARSPQYVSATHRYASSEEMEGTIRSQLSLKNESPEIIDIYAEGIKSTKGILFPVLVFNISLDIYHCIAKNYDVFLCSNMDACLIVSDNYAAVDLSKYIVEPSDKAGWWNVGFPFYCPLAKNFHLYFSPKDLIGANSDDRKISWKRCKATSCDVDRINTLTVSQYERYLYCGSQDELKKYIGSPS